MVSINSSSSAHVAGTESVDVGGDISRFSSSNATDSNTHQPSAGSNPTETVSGSTDSDSAAMNTPQLVGIIAASVIVFVAVLVMICSRRRRHEPKLFTPSNTSAFQGVTSTTASDHSSGASTASTAPTSPQPSLRQTFKLSRLSAKEAPGERVAQDESVNGQLPSGRDTLVSRTISLRSVFTASFLMRDGVRSSIASLSAFRVSRTSRDGVSNGNALQTMDSSTPAHTASTAPYSRDVSVPTPIEQRNTENGVWRDLSDTCWSIGPDSDSETESEWFTMSKGTHAHIEALVLNRNRLSTLSDDIEEEEKHLDTNSLDDSSRRRDLLMSSMDDLSPRRERGISAFDDSSPRRVRGLSALDGRKKANSLAESCFSVDSDFYGETIKDFSSIFFDSDNESSSDSNDSLREEEF